MERGLEAAAKAHERTPAHARLGDRVDNRVAVRRILPELRSRLAYPLSHVNADMTHASVQIYRHTLASIAGGILVRNLSAETLRIQWLGVGSDAEAYGAENSP